MLISLIMQIAQSMQISIRHFLTPQTIYVTFPLKNLAVKNISGLVCLASGLLGFIQNRHYTLITIPGLLGICWRVHVSQQIMHVS